MKIEEVKRNELSKMWFRLYRKK